MSEPKKVTIGDKASNLSDAKVEPYNRFMFQEWEDITIDNSQAEGEPFDLSPDPDFEGIGWAMRNDG